MNLETSLAVVDSAPAPAALSATAAALIPLQHHEKFYSLKQEERDRISILLRMIDEIGTASEGVVAACRRLSLENPARGFSWGTLKNSYYAYLNAGRDWRVLVRRYSNKSDLPAEFIEEVRRRIEANKRGARQAINSLRSDWQRGVSIPGYGTWREWYLTEFPDLDVPERYPFGVYPKGWSQSQLYTLQSSKAERMLARRGFAAAKKYLPHVIRDRSELRRMELITIDDFETDIIVRARHPETGRPEMCTCTGLLAMDVATGRKLAVGLKPRFKSDDGVRMAITRTDVQQLLYSVFTEHGLPAGYGVTILCENASAAITPDFELALETLLGVQVARTGLLAEKTLRNGFVERGGKPWEKGWIESTFNLVHHMAGALPGQKGASYQLKPGDLEAKVLFAEKLLSIEGLTPEQSAELRVPFLPYEDALQGYENIFATADRRTDHRMQGFAEVFDYALPDGSEVVTENELALRNLTRDDVLACTPVSRRESPLARWERIGRDLPLVPVPQAALMLLLLTPKKVTLLNHKISFVHHTQGFTFADADSAVLALPEGTALLGYFDPARPHVLHCTTVDGGYIGPVKRRGTVNIRDHAAIGAEQSEIMRVITKHVLNPVRDRHAAENAQLLADDAHNLAKLREWNVPTKAIPARLLPPAEKAAPNAQRTDLTVDDTGDNQPGTPLPHTASKPAATSLSAKLARHAPARDAFALAKHREALTRGIAQTTATADAAAVTAKTITESDDFDTSALT